MQITTSVKFAPPGQSAEGIPAQFAIPPNQNEWCQWVWLHNAAEAVTGAHISCSFTPPGVRVTFGWVKDPFPADNGLDIGFSAAPTTGFWIGVTKVSADAPEEGTIVLEVTPQ